MSRDELEQAIESVFRRAILRLGAKGNFYELLQVLRGELAAEWLEQELLAAGYSL